jgi:hypothetical protein
LTRRTANPLGPSSWCSALIEGNSLVQCGHQVVQK